MPPRIAKPAKPPREKKVVINRTAPTIQRLLAEFGPDDFVMGIDEAGRGPVLGPMVYACAFCRLGDYSQLSDLQVKDSKQLTERQRDERAQCVRDSDICEYLTCCLAPESLSSWMLQRSPYNLNEISHDAATWLITKVIDLTGGPASSLATSTEGAAEASGNVGWQPPQTPLGEAPLDGFNGWKKPAKGRLRAVFLDTVGPMEAYNKKLERRFPFLVVHVDKKADSKYPIVSAASIMAKTTRDRTLAEWKPVKGMTDGNAGSMGSGYPADPTTKAWLRRSLDRVFGFPEVVRFSWSTSAELLSRSAVAVSFQAEDETEAEHSLFGTRSAKRRRHQLFEELELSPVESL